MTKNTPSRGAGNTSTGSPRISVRNTWSVLQGAFLTVVLVVCAVGVVGAIVSLLLNRRTWDEFDRGHLVLDSEAQRGAGGGGAGAARAAPAMSNAERDEEIRQMIEARNARRRRRGEPELDAEQEIGRLSAPAIDDELRAEIRELVVARNHRRARRGQPPLDIEAEVQREIAAFGGL